MKSLFKVIKKLYAPLSYNNRYFVEELTDDLLKLNVEYDLSVIIISIRINFKASGHYNVMI